MIIIVTNTVEAGDWQRRDIAFHEANIYLISTEQVCEITTTKGLSSSAVYAVPGAQYSNFVGILTASLFCRWILKWF